MASPVSEEDVSFNAAFTAFKFAKSDEERSTASRLLRAELERQTLSLEAAHKRETRAREQEFMLELARLEEQLRQDLKEKDKVTAVRKACVELCMKKLESDPEDANLYANVILSWASKTQGQTATPDWCMGRPLWEKIQDARDKALEEAMVHHAFPQPVTRIAIRVAKMKPEQIKRMSADLEVILKNRGFLIPGQELSAALSATVRLEKKRDEKLQFWKDAATIFTGSVGVIGSVISTVSAIKHVTPDDIEPLINCRHHLPPGWFF